MKHSPRPSASFSDPRDLELLDWAGERLGSDRLDPEPISSDASSRRYFRIRHADRSLVLMDAPPPREDLRPFLRVGAMMQAAGLNVPEVLAADPERGFAILGDLGRHSYLDVLSPGNADALLGLAVNALIRWQTATVADGLPLYDRHRLLTELRLFPEYYLQAHLQLRLSGEERGALDAVFEQVVERALSQPCVYVHRDFMPRNLMLARPAPGVIDFQDALCGPVSYDPVCLFMDAFISWPESRVEGWLEDYRQRARAAGVPVPADPDGFLSDCRWMAVQRHLKVIGIFARIHHRDGKPGYLSDVPRFFRYLRWAVDGEAGLAGLGRLLARWCPGHWAGNGSHVPV